jgi:hypothetical protein
MKCCQSKRGYSANNGGTYTSWHSTNTAWRPVSFTENFGGLSQCIQTYTVIAPHCERFASVHIISSSLFTRGARWRSGSGTMLQTGRSRVRFPMVSLELFSDIILPVALWLWGSTQPLTEMITSCISWGKGGRCVRLTNLPPSCAVVMKSGNVNFLEPSGPHQACNGTALPLPLFTNTKATGCYKVSSISCKNHNT